MQFKLLVPSHPNLMGAASDRYRAQPETVNWSLELSKRLQQTLPALVEQGSLFIAPATKS